MFSRRKLRKGEALFYDGDICRYCWIVLEGAVCLASYGRDGRQAHLAYYGPGEFTGSFPVAKTRRAELFAQSRTELLEVEASRLFKEMESEAILGRGVAAILAKQYDFLLERLASRLVLSAAGRVYAELLQLADDAWTIEPAPIVTTLALTANTTRETTSRALSAAERRGLISRKGGNLQIVSPDRLRSLIV